MIDITRALRRGHPTWPGDTPFALEDTARIADGSSVNLMALSTTTHVGTHLDAPRHYRDDGATLGAAPLELLVGEARVVRARTSPVGPELLDGLGDLPPRVLIRTGQPAAWSDFPFDFAPLAPALVHALADRGVRLVGTDAPSVDAFDSKDLPAHRAFGERGVWILEGLDLSRAPEGAWRLVCLPLPLPDADAAPVRAVLEEARA